MITTNPLFISSRGGSITCFKGDSGRIFQSCSRSRCVYSADLHSAKAYLDNLELRKSLPAAKSIVPPVQRKTTLKWSSDGELSAVDMARILERISNPELTQCDLLCDLEDQQQSIQDSLPTTSWLP